MDCRRKFPESTHADTGTTCKTPRRGRQRKNVHVIKIKSPFQAHYFYGYGKGVAGKVVKLIVRPEMLQTGGRWLH